MPSLVDDPWLRLAASAGEASRHLPSLPSFTEVCSHDPDSLFARLGYTFWNRELVDALHARCAALPVRRWVELAAGTGRLSAELARRGLAIAATDDYSQSRHRVRGYQRPIQYGDWVAELDARRAVDVLRPDAVICAWPPLGSGLVPDLLTAAYPGAAAIRTIVCIGEPGGATEAPGSIEELPAGWVWESWPECEARLIGFNDPPGAPGRNSRLLIFRTILGGAEHRETG